MSYCVFYKHASLGIMQIYTFYKLLKDYIYSTTSTKELDKRKWRSFVHMPIARVSS